MDITSFIIILLVVSVIALVISAVKSIFYRSKESIINGVIFVTLVIIIVILLYLGVTSSSNKEVLETYEASIINIVDDGANTIAYFSYTDSDGNTVENSLNYKEVNKTTDATNVEITRKKLGILYTDVYVLNINDRETDR
jgi:hypothetical protein